MDHNAKATALNGDVIVADNVSSMVEVELEVMRKHDFSWHPCKVSLCSTGVGLVIEYLKNGSNEIIADKEEVVKRIRIRSIPLEDVGCTSIQQGDHVLAKKRVRRDTLLLDSTVDKALNSKKAHPRCTFVVKWTYGQAEGETATIPCNAMWKVSSKSIKSHPTIIAFFNISRSSNLRSVSRFMEEQKKWTLDALDRRFAQAAADARNQQDQSTKRPRQDKHKVSHKVTNPSNPVVDTAKPSKKGNFSFSGHTVNEDIDGNDPVYCQLSHSLDEHVMTNVGKDFNGRSTVDHLLDELFQHGDASEKYMQGSRSMKIDNWILLDNFVQKSGVSATARLQNLRLNSKKLKKRMSMKQHKKCGLLHLPAEFHNFDRFKPMHEMWKSYIIQLLKNVGKNQVPQCLLNADLHGAIVSVVSCKINSYLGVRGIMIRETAETLGIITEDNKFRVVPKKPSVFMFEADCWKTTVFGDKLVSRTLW